MKSLISHLLDSAAPLGVMCSTSIATSASFSANYEDLNEAIALIGAETPGTYENTIYYSWATRADNASLVCGYAPHSPPNSIITSARLQASNGTPSFIVAPPYMNASFKSFWFACNLDTEETTFAIGRCSSTMYDHSYRFSKEEQSRDCSRQLHGLAAFEPRWEVCDGPSFPSEQFHSVYNVTVVPDNLTEHTLPINNLVYTLSK